MKAGFVKMSKSDKEYFVKLICHDIITKEDIDKFEKIFNEFDQNFIEYKKGRCAWWTLMIGSERNKDDRYRNLIEKYEKLICERIKKRISK